jgi:PKD repeat protein
MHRRSLVVGIVIGVVLASCTGASAACADFPLDRAQMACLVASGLAGGYASVPDSPATPTFPDVSTDHWALKYVQYAVSQGVVKGYEDGRYHPEYPCTRDQMAVCLARALNPDVENSYTPPTSSTFPDVPTDFWAYKHIEYCLSRGVPLAWPDSPSLFRPDYPMYANTAASWLEQVGLPIDSCAMPDPLVADFGAEPREGTAAPLIVRFTDTSLGRPVAWSWDFGDGMTSAEQNPVHTYETIGTFTVSLMVTRAEMSDTRTVPGFISIVPIAPIASFSGDPASGRVPLQVQFADESRGDPTSWLWDFGDGSTSAEQNPTHTYPKHGSYTVSLTAANELGEGVLTAPGYISAAGETIVEAWRGGLTITQPSSVSVNSTDGSVWIGERSGSLGHLSVSAMAATYLKYQFSAFGMYVPTSVSVNPTDGSCWGTGFEDSQVVHVGADGAVLTRRGDFDFPRSLCVNPSDGSCWVADYHTDQVVHLGADGAELWRGGVFDGPSAVSVNPVEGSCWVADYYGGTVVHLAADGTELWREWGFYWPSSVSVNSTDGSVWVADYGHNEVVHLRVNGNELWRGGGFLSPDCLAVNPADGSCWVADTGNNRVVHLGQDGTQLWRSAGHPTFQSPESVTVNTTDGSCWVADYGNDQVVHLTVHTDFGDVPSYHWAFHEIQACYTAGIVKGYDDDLYHPEYTVTRDQMAVYVSRGLVSPSGDAGIPDPEPPASFSDVPTNHWAYKHIEYAVSQKVVQGYEDGTYRPGLTVDRGQMAVYVARATVAPGGDAAVPDPPATATFPDVPTTFWAYRHVEFCADRSIVQGYDDGLYHPDYPVTRDQMAVYIARAFALPM